MIPSWAVTAPRSAYVPVYGEVSSGDGRGPMLLDAMDLRCADETVCAVRLAKGTRAVEGRVAGLRAGDTDVIMTYRHPLTKVPGESRFHVRFVEGDGASLAVGQPLPPDDRREGLLIAKDIPGTSLKAVSCYHDSADPLRDLGAPYEKAVAQNAFFWCEAPVEVVAGQTHLCLSSMMQSRWNWGDHTGERIIACASLAGGAVAGLRYYATPQAGDRKLLGDVGTVDDTQCPRF